MSIKRGGIREIDKFWCYIAPPEESRIPKKTIEIYDPVFGYVEFSKDERFLLDLAPVQRLRRLSQLGVGSLVYPGATQTRFSHSVGVFYLAKRALESISKGQGKEIDERHDILYAALLHDICHFPFSHTTETVFKENFGPGHETLGADFVKESEYFRTVFDLINDKWKIKADRQLISDCIEGKDNKKSCLTRLINGEIDIDKIDYLARDAHFTGVPFGKIDVERIIKTLTILKERGAGILAVESKGLTSVESLITGRSLMFKSVYNHHTKLAAEAMLIRATHAYVENEMPAIRLLELDDGVLMSRLLEAKGYPKKIAKRLIQRDLLKRLSTLEIRHIKDETVLEKFLNRKLSDRILLEQKVADELGLEKGSLLLQLVRPPDREPIDFPIVNGSRYKPLYRVSAIVGAAYDEDRLNWRSYFFYKDKDKKIEQQVKFRLGRDIGLVL